MAMFVDEGVNRGRIRSGALHAQYANSASADQRKNWDKLLSLRLNRMFTFQYQTTARTKMGTSQPVTVRC